MQYRRWIRVVGTAALLALGLAGAELATRLAVGPPRAEAPLDAGQAPLHEPDPELGWRNRAGTVTWPGRGRDAGRPIRFTFWPGGRRATGPHPVAGRPELVVVGCSYTQGWALSDSDTYPWQLQERLPELTVVNLGTAAYGTHQALLSLERHLAESSEPLARVVYGMIEHHELRNVAPAAWMRRLTSATAEGRLAVPWATLGDGGALERHPPERYPRLPGGNSFASVALLQWGLARWREGDRAERPRAVTEALLEQLRDTGARRGAPLLVALLKAEPEARLHYRRWLPEHGIAFVDCIDPRVFDPRFAVPGYGHPGRELDAFWAACIGRALDAVP